MPESTTFPPSAEPAVTGLLVTLDPPAGRILLTGELDRATCGLLAEACPALASAAAPVWVLDLAGLSFCDASGLRALAAVRRVAAAAGAAVIVAGARPYLRRLLPLVDLCGTPTPVTPTAPAAGRTGRAPAVRLAAPERTPTGPPWRGAGALVAGERHAAGRA